MEYSVWKKEFEKIKPYNLETITEYDKENKREGLTEKTRGNSIQIMLILAKQFQKPFKDITRGDLNNYIDALKTSNGTKRQYVIQIRKFFRWLHHKKNPDCIKDLKVPKVKEVKKNFLICLQKMKFKNS